MIMTQNIPQKKVKKCLEGLKIDVLDWPSQSTDLNSIEHFWSQLKLDLEKYENPPNGILELWDRVQ